MQRYVKYKPMFVIALSICLLFKDLFWICYLHMASLLSLSITMDLEEAAQ